MTSERDGALELQSVPMDIRVTERQELLPPGTIVSSGIQLNGDGQKHQSDNTILPSLARWRYSLSFCMLQ